MNNDNWQKAKEIFVLALEIPTEKRPRFLADKCGDNTTLRREVESLLANYAPEFMGNSPKDKIIELITNRLSVGQKIGGRYLILDRLGKGGMGEVYLARDLKLNRLTALKVLTEELSQDKERLKQFEEEARKASQIDSDNIVKVYDFDEADGISFITAEYFESETLRRKLEASRLKIEAFFSISLQVAAALEAAHQKNIVHKDIKPENILINDKGQVKILDFGIAHLNEPEISESSGGTAQLNQTERAAVFGSISYMSPEQIREMDSGQINRIKINHRTDIWSFGVCMYEMLAGEKPFSGESRIDKFASILKDEIAPLDAEVSEDLGNVIRKALQKNREERYKSIGELRAELEKLKDQPAFSEIDTFREWRHSRGVTISQILLYGVFLCFMISLGLSIFYPGAFGANLSDKEMAARNFQIVGSFFI